MYKVYGAHATNDTYTANNGKTYTHCAEDIFTGTVQQLHPAQVSDLIAEYVQEAAHNGWEGFNRRDLTGINKLLKDIALYLHNQCEYDAHIFARAAHIRAMQK